MRPLPILTPDLLLLLRRQDGVLTTRQLGAGGLSPRQIQTLIQHGWQHPVRGALIAPDVRSPLRASWQAALLTAPRAVLGGVSAGRLHDLSGLPEWRPDEQPQLLLHAGARFHQRKGVRYRSGLRDGERARRLGMPCSTLSRTVADLAIELPLDDLVCLLDSALRLGWHPPERPTARLRQAVLLSDARSESAFETRMRLLFTRAGIPPETLQFEIFDRDGRLFARLDFAWPSCKLAVEADGRRYHDAPEAVYRDRFRGNQLEIDGWTVLRFTWADLMRRPDWIVTQVREVLSRRSVR